MPNIVKYEGTIKEIWENEESNKEHFVTVLKEVGISIESIKTINGQNDQIKVLDDQANGLNNETLALNTDTKNREAKYPVSDWGYKGIWYFNEKNDKDIS